MILNRQSSVISNGLNNASSELGQVILAVQNGAKGNRPDFETVSFLSILNYAIVFLDSLVDLSLNSTSSLKSIIGIIEELRIQAGSNDKPNSRGKRGSKVNNSESAVDGLAIVEMLSRIEGRLKKDGRTADKITVDNKKDNTDVGQNEADR